MQVKKEFLNMATTNAKSKANAKYIKNNVKRIAVNFFPADMEIYEYACSHPQKSTYIKDLIRADLAARKAEEEK